MRIIFLIGLPIDNDLRKLQNIISADWDQEYCWGYKKNKRGAESSRLNSNKVVKMSQYACGNG